MQNWIHGFLDRPRKAKLRALLFQVHLWTGLGVGLYILAMSLTGSALVFREEIEAAYPSAARSVEVQGEPASLESVRALAAERYPGYRVAWIREPEQPDVAHDVWVEKDADSRLTLISPYGPAFLEEVRATTSFWIFLQDFHFYLFSGATGFLVNGVGGLLLAVMCLTGVIIWWPGRRKWQRALTVKRNVGWKRFNWDLHTAGGMWLLIFVSIWAITGAYFAFPEPFIQIVASVLPTAPPPPQVEAPPQGTPLQPVDALVRSALAAVPGSRVDWVGLPHHEGEHLATIYLVPAGDEGAGESTYVHLNPYSGKVLGVDRPEDRAAGDVALGWFGKLHFGNFGGWPVKALWVVLGLSPAALFITGFTMWWNRVLSKSWKRWSVAEPAPPKNVELTA